MGTREPVVMAIDPGPERSAGVVFPSGRGGGVEAIYGDNAEVAKVLEYCRGCGAMIVIEDVEPRGTPFGWATRNLAVWVGVFWQAARRDAILIRPNLIRSLVSGPTATRSGLRVRMLDLWGGEVAAVGNRRCRECRGKGCASCVGGRTPRGPLNEIGEWQPAQERPHLWSALAVAVAAAEAGHLRWWQLGLDGAGVPAGHPPGG